MGLMAWMRGGDDNSASSGVISAALTAIDGIFRPSRVKQMEFVEESKRKRHDLTNGSDIDLDSGRAVIRYVKSSTAPTSGRAPRVHVPRRQGWWQRLRLSMQMKGLRGRNRGVRRGLALGAARERVQQLARILKIAAPQHRGAFARQAVRGIGSDAVVGDKNALRRRGSALRAPPGGAGFIGFSPANERARIHGATFARTSARSQHPICASGSRRCQWKSRAARPKRSRASSTRS